LTPVQKVHGPHPAYLRIGTGSFPGVKCLGRGFENPPQFSVEVKERVEIYIYSTYGSSWPVLGQALPLKTRDEEFDEVTVLYLVSNIVVPFPLL